MIKLLNGVTENTVGGWVKFTAGNNEVKSVMKFGGLSGATGIVEVRYDDDPDVFVVHSTTSDELKLAELVGNLHRHAESSSSYVNTFELRGKLEDAQAGTDATIGIT